MSDPCTEHRDEISNLRSEIERLQALYANAVPNVVGLIAERDVLKALVADFAEVQICRNCPDVGYAIVPNSNGEPEQEQCRFCYTEPRSLFNLCDRARTLLQGKG